MRRDWPLLNWPREFPLLYTPVCTSGPSPRGYTLIDDVACGLGISSDGLGILNHRKFGPRTKWLKAQARSVVLDHDLDDWMKRDWRRGEQNLLAELQHTHPADFLEARAQSSLKSIGELQRTMQ